MILVVGFMVNLSIYYACQDIYEFMNQACHEKLWDYVVCIE